MADVPIFAILGLLLSMAIIARALLGGAYRGSRSVGGRNVGHVMLFFGVAMWIIFLIRIIRWYHAQ